MGYEPTDIAAVSVGLTRSVLSSEANGGLQFGEADEDGWEDTDDEDEDDDLHDHIHGQPECAPTWFFFRPNARSDCASTGG